MFLDRPYFMENEDWYYFDSSTKRFELTSEAPQKAIESHKKFYEELAKEQGK